MLSILGLLTWLLQMLDLYVFHTLKSRLRQLHMGARLASPTGGLGKHQWIPLVGQAITEILVQRDHTRSFRRCGLEAGMPRLRDVVRGYLPPVSELPIRPLTDDEVSELVGRRRVNMCTNLFNGPNRIAGMGAGIDVAESTIDDISSDESQLPHAVPLLSGFRLRYVVCLMMID